jgi:hypothetical protein
VARNIDGKFGAKQFSNFVRFFQAAISLQNGRRDVIDDVIEPSVLSDEFHGGKEPPRQVWRDRTVSDFSTIF